MERNVFTVRVLVKYAVVKQCSASVLVGFENGPVCVVLGTR